MGGDGHSTDDALTRPAAAVSRPSVTVGPYRLLQPIGEGGMGSVWLADQQQPVHRQVALKLIKAGMDTAQVIARFEAERQALALMDHPAIAKVFDAGATSEGRPYFAMEYVKGEPITAYAVRHKLPLRQRIDLFMEVCKAVQHAHQKGIIHRDLKPSNVLVTIRDDAAVPKIIDFGVAKAMTQSLTDRTLVTEFGAVVGTPEYMSPEQAEMSGLDVDTRTDVYALGVILYELLTGTLPFDGKALRQQSLEDVRRTIRDVDAPKPSTRVATATTVHPVQAQFTREWATRLRGDLDWITLKALEKDRTRRYGSASDLEADLRRYLDNVPVLACPPTTTYRIGKFVRRHRGGVAAASAAAVMLLVVAAMTLVQARRVARERDRANAEALTATQVSDFLAGLFKVSDPSESRGKTLTAQELLERGTSRIESELASQPEVQARLLMTLAGVYEGLGMFAKQGELAEKAHAIRSRLVGADAQDTINALTMVGSSRYKRGQYDEAERMWKQVLERTRANLGTNDRVYLVALSNYSSVLAALGRWKEAEVTTREALDASRRLFGETSSRAVTSMANLGAILQMVDKPAEAQTYYRAAIEESRKQRGADHPGTLVYMSNLAESLEDQGKLAESESLHREVLTARRRVLPAQHSSTAVSLVNLASVLNQRHQYVEAESFAREALDIFQKNTAADYWQIAHATTVVAEAQLGQNRSAEVGPALIAAVERILASSEPWPSAKRRAIRRVVDFYTATGDVQHAAAWRSKVPSAPSLSS